MTPTDTLARDVSLTLANAMERHGFSCEALAEHLTRNGSPISATVVKRWRNTADARTIQADRLAKLPAPVLRDVLEWFASQQNAIIVDQVAVLGCAKSDRELTLDLIFASNSLAQWLRSREGDVDALCNSVVASVERARMGLNRRPLPRLDREAA